MATKNKLVDLNNHLFAQLERLNDDELSAEDIDMECKRTRAITMISGQIIKNACTILRAAKLISNGDVGHNETPDVFGVQRKSIE